MDLSGFEKIKINHAIVVFLIIINCLFYPLTILLAINPKLFFEYDQIKLVGAVICVGGTNFGIVYTYTALLTAFTADIWVDKNRNFLFQQPLLVTIFCLTVVYTVTITSITIGNGNLIEAIKTIAYCDGAMFIGQVGSTIDTARRKRRDNKSA